MMAADSMRSIYRIMLILTVHGSSESKRERKAAITSHSKTKNENRVAVPLAAKVLQ